MFARRLIRTNCRRFTTSGNPSSPLGGRESALEEKFIYEHEKEVIAKLRKDLAEKEKRLAEKVSKSKLLTTSPIVSETGHQPSDAKTVADETIRLSPLSAASGTFGKREAAAEEQYFRRLEQEKIEHLKHPHEKK